MLAGDDGWADVLKLVKREGRIAYPNGVSPEPSVVAGAEAKAFDAANDRHAFDRLNKLIAMAPFHIELSRVYPLDEAGEALRAVNNHHLGKVALRIHPS